MISRTMMAGRLLGGVILLSLPAHSQSPLDALPSAQPGLETTSQHLPASLSGRSRSPAPVPDATRASLEQVREIYAGEYAAATTPAKKADLAKRLMANISDTTNAADRWTLLSESLRLATESGDAATALPIIERIPREFAVERHSSRLEALTRLSQKAAVADLGDVVKAVLSLAGEASAADDQAVCSKATTLAVALARKAKNQALLLEATRQQQNMREHQKLAKELTQLVEKARDNPSDGEACEAAGVALCLKADRWGEGLPFLAKGADTALAALAKAELSKPANPSEVVRLADGWWEWSAAQKAAIKEGAIRRAARFYESVLPDLAGLEKVKVEKRLHEATLGVQGSEKPVFLADIKEAGVKGAKYGFSKDGTYMGKPFKCMQETWPKAIAAIPEGNAPAVVEYHLPAPASRIQGRVGVFSPSDAKPDQQPGSPLVFEVVADGKVVWRSQPMDKRDTSQAFRADLRGASSIELRTNTESGYAAWGVWLDPQVVR